jgi:starch synthase (maltosyl-transferring)
VSTKKLTLESLPTVVIENIDPCIDGGRYPIKRVVGQDLKVSADVFKEGHDQVSVNLKWRKVGQADWYQTPMRPLENDRWEAVCHFIENALHEFTIEAWEDHFKSWQVEYAKKFGAGNTELRTELEEGSGGKGGESRHAQTRQGSVAYLFQTIKECRCSLRRSTSKES